MHFYPYRVSPMSDATVADELTFASWTDEQKRIARAIVRQEVEDEEEVGDTSLHTDEEYDELEAELIALKDKLRDLADA